MRHQLLLAWNEQREPARNAGQAVLAGPGRLGLRLLAVNRATETLAQWSITWQPYLSDMPTSTTAIARYATRPHHQHRITDAFDRVARIHAEHARPEHPDLQRTAEDAAQQWRRAQQEIVDLRNHYDTQLYRHGRLGHADNLDQRTEQLDQTITDNQARLDRINCRINRLSHEPAVTAQPDGWIQREHERWCTDDVAQRTALRHTGELHDTLAIGTAAVERLRRSYAHEHHSMQRPTREGPSFGR